MSIKTLLFALFLYVCLVWVAVAYLDEGTRAGLLWTAIGIIALLAFLILQWIAGWWRLRRARAAARPVTPARPVPAVVVHEDDAALAALLEEANTALASAPGYRAERGRRPLYELPVYLLIGPEGSGKTSAFVNSGLEPQLLAGQVTGSGPLLPTRLCNIWLAGKAIFVELSGRTFSGDIGRWKELLGVLRGKPTVPLWRRLWGTPVPRMELRAVIGFCEVKEFTGASADPQRLERQSRDWQERLRAIAEVFGAEFPVYQVITKSDGIPFFPEFFRRLPETEASQILGCTLPLNRADALRRGEVFAEAEAKRLTASFRSLYHRLAARRMIHLAHEPDPAKRPAVYEFPRELKRIRSSLVQFLTDVFRPNALRPGPLLRGYYLVGTRLVQSAALDPGTTRSDWYAPGLEATRLFHATDATKMFSPDDANKSGERRGMTQRWTFVGDLFRELVLAEPPRRHQPREDVHLGRMREYAFTGIVAVCALLCLIFLGSWWGNRGMLQSVEAAGAVKATYSRPPSLTDLQALEKLRAEVERLRQGAGWSLHWGLYSGDRMLEPARTAYFRRFRLLLLDALNGDMVQTLATVPDAADRYDPIYRTLQTHLIIANAGCGLDPELVSRTLQEQERSQFVDVGPEWRQAADKHIAFYASELPYGNPSPVSLDTVARDHARQYLAKGKSDEAAYRAILLNAEKNVAKPQRLVDVAPDYAKVMTGPGEVSPAFSPTGWIFVEKASKERKSQSLDSCVTGAQSVAVGDTQAIQQRYLREYMDQWSKYLAGFSVTRYNGAEDAARRLGTLSDNKSPLLALLAMAAKQTVFEGSAPSVIKQAGDTFAKKVEKTFGRAAPRLEERAKPELLTTASITNAFQPVHLVTPASSPTLVSEKNTPYVEALRQLRTSMQDMALSNNPEAANPARDNSRKALEATQKLADGFRLADAASLSTTVKRLLEEPIRHAERLIPPPPNKEKDITTALGRLNGNLAAMLGKYPFNRKSRDDVTLTEFDTAFAPVTGAIWVFQAKNLAEVVVKEHGQWRPTDPAKTPQVATDLLPFLNHAQKITDAFYPPGATSAHFNYALLPKLDPAFQEWFIELEADGKKQQWNTGIRSVFTWPAAKVADQGASMRVGQAKGLFPIYSHEGLWGIFKVMDHAEPRPLEVRVIRWKEAGQGKPEPIKPAPIDMTLAELPAGTDVFNRDFLGGFRVPRSK